MNVTELIAAYTGISIERQSEIEFEKAYKWVGKQLEGEPETANTLMLDPAFWDWWRGQWKAMDTAFADGLKVDHRTGIISAYILGNECRTQVTCADHLANIWLDYHHIGYVKTNHTLVYGSYVKHLKHQLKQLFK